MDNFNIYGEIHDQPETWKSIIKSFREEEKKIKEFLDKKDIFIFTGCGSGHNASVYSKNISEFFLNKACYDYQASEIKFYAPEIFNKGDNLKMVTFLFSRSGDTTETVDALKNIKENKFSSSFGITCYEDSFLYKNCDYSFSLAEANEKAVTTTKSLTSMDLLSILIFNSLSDSVNLTKSIDKLPDLCKKIIENFESLAKKIGENDKINKFFLLANMPNFGIARESKLKLLEMTLSWADCFNTLDFRHGPKAVIDKNSLVTIFLTNKGVEYELQVAKEMKELGAELLILGDKIPDNFYKLTENIIDLGENVSEWIRGILFLPFIQLLSYYKALKKGLDPDNPKNLSYFVEIK
jgi:glutamine---fructose-6-phosphate transaminase (isomerizing)